MIVSNYLMKALPDPKGRYIVLDTETTGVDIKQDHLINISAVEILDGKITGTQFNAYVRSRDYKNAQESFSKNKFYYVEDYSKELFEIEKHTLIHFLNFVGDSIIFAHNACFDAKFINYELSKSGLITIPVERFRCSLMLSKKLIKMRNKKYTLESLCRHFKFSFNKDDFHHGLFDAFMCARIVCKLFELNSREIGVIENDDDDVNINSEEKVNVDLPNPNEDLKHENKLDESLEEFNNINKINNNSCEINNIRNPVNLEIDDILKEFNDLKINIYLDKTDKPHNKNEKLELLFDFRSANNKENLKDDNNCSNEVTYNVNEIHENLNSNNERKGKTMKNLMKDYLKNK